MEVKSWKFSLDFAIPHGCVVCEETKKFFKKFEKRAKVCGFFADIYSKNNHATFCINCCIIVLFYAITVGI